MTESKQAWIDRWRAQALPELTERFRSRGADDPEGWAQSELREDIAQFSRYVFLQALWEELIGCMASTANEIEAYVSEGMATRERIEHSLASSLYVLGFNLAYMLDDPADSPSAEVGDDEPRWRLMELSPPRDPDDFRDRGELTGRDVGGLHESLMGTFPGGGDAGSEQGWF